MFTRVYEQYRIIWFPLFCRISSGRSRWLVIGEKFAFRFHFILTHYKSCVYT